MADDRNDIKLRLCLKCRNYFQSSSAGNRRCPKCKKQTPSIDPNYQPVEFSSYYHQTELAVIKQTITQQTAQRQCLDEQLCKDR